MHVYSARIAPKNPVKLPPDVVMSILRLTPATISMAPIIHITTVDATTLLEYTRKPLHVSDSPSTPHVDRRTEAGRRRIGEPFAMISMWWSGATSLHAAGQAKASSVSKSIRKLTTYLRVHDRHHLCGRHNAFAAGEEFAIRERHHELATRRQRDGSEQEGTW